MALDPTNPELPLPQINPEYLVTQQRLAKAAEVMALSAGAGNTPVTEAGIYLQILIACIMGRVATNSADLQIWANDLTADYMKKYSAQVILATSPPKIP